MTSNSPLMSLLEMLKYESNHSPIASLPQHTDPGNRAQGISSFPDQDAQSIAPLPLCQHRVLPHPCIPHSHINIVLTSNIITRVSLGCRDCLHALSIPLPHAIQQEILSTEIKSKKRNKKEPCTSFINKENILSSINASKRTSRPLPRSLQGRVSSLQRGHSRADRGVRQGVPGASRNIPPTSPATLMWFRHSL